MFIGLVSNAKPSLFEASRHEQSLSKLYVLLRSRSGMIAIAMPDYNRPAGSVWPSATSIVMLTGVIWLRNGRRLSLSRPKYIRSNTELMETFRVDGGAALQ
ncbi:hypothetical protein Pst134EA_031723 [Puccinia striiformis f. sp. tritici]|uniref:uncharacterized protein n=1 Tax=Puccinia striiformis f. sp. tritici TaxID=168172 RepID=UPI00200724C8|nr:uncharacterized protein Pst134EA_031723 [Puccinia striiformis f. sp. tritici]KAH9445192.1 hypothetical protein Pst134EA_031723 [Puccinia striiformis f. sp. tritici]